MTTKISIDDAGAMFENWASDERVTHYLTWCPHKSPEVTKQLLELWCRKCAFLLKFMLL